MLGGAFKFQHCSRRQQNLFFFGRLSYPSKCSYHLGSTVITSINRVVVQKRWKSRENSLFLNMDLEAASAPQSQRGLSPIPEFNYEANTLTSMASTTSQILASLTNTDLAFEWSMLCQDCTDCWTGNGKKRSCANFAEKCGFWKIHFSSYIKLILQMSKLWKIKIGHV